MSELPLPRGIDISKYQFSQDGTQKPDFDKINSTCDFVAVRAGISWGYVDPWFRYSWEHIEKPRLAYHVVYPGEWSSKQMAHFLDIVKPREHDRLVLDMELDHGYSKARITNTLLECLEFILANTGRYPVIYSRASWVNEHLEVSALPPNLDWWLAHYLTRRPYPLYTPERDSPPALPRGVNSWFMHQTGERGNGSAVGVVSHYVDTNRFNGTKAELLAYFGLDDEVPPEPEPPEDPDKLFDARVYSWAKPYLNFRSEPRIAPETDIGDIETGTKLPIYEIVGDWYRTSYKGTNGFVMSKFLERLDFEPPSMIIDIPPLWQKDPRWGHILLGYSSWMTLASDGCLATDFAMVFGVTPAEFNARMQEVGGFTGAKVYWQMVKVAYPDSEYLKYIECYYVPAPLHEIDALLEQGVPVMVHVTRNGYMHWVLIVGKNGNDYIINDPIDGMRASFLERYGDPARWILRIVAYRRQA